MSRCVDGEKSRWGKSRIRGLKGKEKE